MVDVCGVISCVPSESFSIVLFISLEDLISSTAQKGHSYYDPPQIVRV